MKREFAGHIFEHVGLIDPERDTSGAVREFMPQSRYRNARDLPLNRHGAGPFCRFSIARGLNLPGVYVLALSDEPAYVGKCANLAHRFGPTGYGAIQPKNCFVGGQSTNCKINNLVLQYVKAGKRLDLWFHATGETEAVERELIVKIRPAWNGQVPW
jgi:hypothetical protein